MASIFNKLIPTIAQGASKWIGYGGSSNGGVGALPARDSGIASFKVPTDSLATISYPSGGVEPTVGASQAEDTSLLTYSDLVEAPVSGGSQGSTTAVFNLATSFRNYYLLDKFVCYADFGLTPTADAPNATPNATNNPGGNGLPTTITTSSWYAMNNYMNATTKVTLTSPTNVARREMQYFLSSPEFVYSWFNQIQFRYGNTVIQQWVNPSCDVILRSDAPHNQLTLQGKHLYEMGRGIDCGIGLYRKPELMPANTGVFASGSNGVTYPRLRWKLFHPFMWTPAKTLPSGAIHSLGITFYYTNNPSSSTNTHIFALAAPMASLSIVSTSTAVVGVNPIFETTWAFTKSYISSFTNFNISSITISQNSSYHDVSPVLDLQQNIPIVNWQLVNQQTLTLNDASVKNQTTSIVFESRFPQFLAIVSDVYLKIGGSVGTILPTKLTGYLPITAVRYLARNNNKYAYWRFIEDHIAANGAMDITAFAALVKHRNAEVSGLVWNSRADVDPNGIGGNLLAHGPYYNNWMSQGPNDLEKLYRGPAQTPAATASMAATGGINLNPNEYGLQCVNVSNTTLGVTAAVIEGQNETSAYSRELIGQRIAYVPVIQPHDSLKLNNTGNGTLQINYDILGRKMCTVPAIIPGTTNPDNTPYSIGSDNIYVQSGSPNYIEANANIYIYAAYYNNVTLGNNVEAVQQDMSDIFSANRAI